MRLICSTILFATLISHICAQGDLDSLISEVFKSGGGAATTAKSTDIRSPDGSGAVTPASGGAPLEGAGGIEGVGSCTCVPYYQCNNNTINTDGTGLIDIRIQDGPCSNYLEICCNPPEIQEEKITPAPPINKPTGCGRRNAEGIGFRITGDNDNEAQFGEFPWMVAVLREETVEGNPQKLNVYQCGGALIHPQVVLTAAHCVTGKDKRFKVRAGEWDTQTKNELYEHQDREVKSAIIHPQFYSGALHNDVALLILEKPVEIAENVDVVCLPPQDMVVDNTRCLASGWGKDVFGKEGKYQVILKKIDLPIVNRNACQNSLRNTRLGKFFELHRSFICAGGEIGKDTCKGDGGSPLVCPVPGQPNRYMQAGIVAWGIGCGEKQIPGVYVNIPLFRNWINEQMTYNKFEMSAYQY